jgi:parallel beta-helix repeat protein
MQYSVRFSPARWWPFLLAGCVAISARCSAIVVTNTAPSGPGSFQQAILDANAAGGSNSIVFQISGSPPFTIAPTNVLPQISVQVVIDGTSQSGYSNKPVIELNGASTGSTTAGLRFGQGSSGSVLRGLTVNRFAGTGIDVNNVSNVAIRGNFVGTDVTGTIARGNGGTAYAGIFVNSGAWGITIGGTNAGDANLISANYIGLYFQNSSNNVVQGNIVGLNAAGTAALGNSNHGILINPGYGNRIGGLPAAQNTISGNTYSGIYISTGSTGNVIQRNRIGTDLSGSGAIGNGNSGVWVNGGTANLISSNLISANGQVGVSLIGGYLNQVAGNYIGTDASGGASLSNHLAGVQISGGGGNLIGGSGNGNVISGNGLDGISLLGGTLTNTIQGNLIGVSAAGTNALRNLQNGITLTNASFNLIGGTTAAARNVISGNAAYGIFIEKLTDTGNAVQGNYIGTDIAGARAVSNVLEGVLVKGMSNLIGGAVSGAGNVISGNGQRGIYLLGSGGNVSNNVVQGNLIGLDATGTRALGNISAGVGISDASGNVIGGTNAAARNIVSANGNTGATGLGGVFFANAGATQNRLQGNYIGTDITGMNAVGNLNDGVTLEQGATGNFIAGNLISANSVDGVYLINTASNIIQGNFIGTKADGTNDLGNIQQTLELQSGATNNIIGGTAPGAGNRIAYAKTALYAGVRVRNGAFNNLISGNSIFNNAGLGIDLGVNGVTANTDCESGMTSAYANYGQNYPVLSNAVSGVNTRVRGFLNSKISRAYTLQFFASPVSAGSGEGQLYLGQTNLTLGSACSSNFTAYLSTPVPAGWVVTATATDPNNNTSEFSAGVSMISLPPLQLSLPGTNRLSLSWTNNGGSFALQQASNLTPPVNWFAVTNVPLLQSNFLVTTLGMTNSSIFYRLIAQ